MMKLKKPCNTCKEKKLSKPELKQEILRLREKITVLRSEAQTQEQRDYVERVAKSLFKATDKPLENL